MIQTEQGTLKLQGWQRQKEPDPAICERLRQYISEIIFSRWNMEHKPCTLTYINSKVQARIAIEYGTLWPTQWRIVGKRTVDRRVNEVADPRFYKDGVAKVVAVTSGLYEPNPELFK